MNSDGLLAHFERIADAPDAIPRLRRFILDLAVRGKLVPQDPTEGVPSESVRRLFHPGKISAAPEGPFAVPNGWVWARVTSLADTRLGKMLDKSKNKGRPHRYLRNANVRWFDFDLSNLLEMRFEDSELPEFELRGGDVLICEGGEPGRAAVWDARETDIYFQKAIHRVRFCELVDPHYFVNALRQSDDDGRLAEFFTGTGIKHFTGKGLDTYLFPLPPLAEQGRIVAKVDELTALCDRLETARAERETKRDRLTAASFARLNSPDPETTTFATDPRFALDALPALTARTDLVKHLRDSILTLALSGRLSESANWPRSPTPLSKVASLQNGYAFKSEWFSGSGVRLLRNVNVSHGRLNWAQEARLPQSMVAAYERFRLQEHDIVLSLDRPLIATGTKVARVRAEDLPALLLQRVGRFVLTADLDPDYLFIWINSPSFSSQIDPGRSNGIPHISSKQAEAAVLFIPPVAEQRRIVAKVNELMALCDRLEASLSASDNTRSRLLGALLADALAPVASELQTSH